MAIYLAPLTENDETGQGLCMPSEISCCDEEEAVIVQRKLDTIIAELRDIKSILCKHQEKFTQPPLKQSEPASPASASPRGSGELEMATFNSSLSTQPSSSSMDLPPRTDESKPLLLKG